MGYLALCEMGCSLRLRIVPVSLIYIYTGAILLLYLSNTNKVNGEPDNRDVLKAEVISSQTFSPSLSSSEPGIIRSKTFGGSSDVHGQWDDGSSFPGDSLLITMNQGSMTTSLGHLTGILSDFCAFRIDPLKSWNLPRWRLPCTPCRLTGLTWLTHYWYHVVVKFGGNHSVLCLSNTSSELYCSLNGFSKLPPTFSCSLSNTSSEGDCMGILGYSLEAVSDQEDCGVE
jgi:hypothetical protein